MDKIDNQQGATRYHRVFYSIFCDNLYGEKSEKDEYVYMYNWITLLYTWH